MANMWKVAKLSSDETTGQSIVALTDNIGNSIEIRFRSSAEDAALEAAKRHMTDAACAFDSKSRLRPSIVDRAKSRDLVLEYREGSKIRTVEWLDLPDLQSARAEAVRSAIDLANNLSTTPKGQWLVRILDGTGEVLVSVSDVEAQRMHQNIGDVK